MHHDDLRGVIRWFTGRHDHWSRSTIKQYRAAIVQAIEDAAPELEMGSAEELMASLRAGPEPRKFGPQRTSARKRRSVPEHEFALLMRRLADEGHHPDDGLAARLLSHNVSLCLRPSEWRTATIQRNILIIRNGKATNGRALGSHRRLDLKEYGSEGVSDLSKLLVVLRRRAQGAESLRRLWKCLAARIARACEHIDIKRVSPYTTRHVGMANAKGWMSPEEVAATAGHKTTATAMTHYARRRTGWRTKPEGIVRPIAEDVAKVIRSPKVCREANMEFIAKRNEAEDDTPTFKF